MARLTAAARNALPDSAFAGPGRSYPINDKSHAIAAEGMSKRFAGKSQHGSVVAQVKKKFPGLAEKSTIHELP